MSALAAIILRAGLVPDESLQEFRRWRLPLPEGQELSNPLLSKGALTKDGLVEALEQAMQSEGYVLTRETDLDVLSQFLSTMRPATLRLFTDTVQDVEIRTMVGKNSLGEYILPWQADSIVEWLMNGQTYLVDGGSHIYFSQARDLFYGGNKAFVLCGSAGAIV